MILGHFAATAAAAATSEMRFADLVMMNGNILTVDSNDSVVQAIAVKGTRIADVGSTERIRRLVGPQTTVIDLRGLTASPGLIDSHAHVAYGGYSELYGLDLSDASDIDEIARLVQNRVHHLARGRWVVGNGWDEGKLRELRYIYALDLDKASPGNPVLLIHATGHYGVANSAALARAGVTDATPDPAAGTIDRDASGHATGILKEAALDLVMKAVPPVTRAQRSAGILHVLNQLRREGMTAFKDPDIYKVDWDAYLDLANAGKLTARVCVLWHGGATLMSVKQVLATLKDVPRAPHAIAGRLMSCGVKLFMDGSGGARTGWVYEEWNQNFTGVDRGNYGYPATNPDVYREQVTLLHRAGIHVGTHAIGDRAIDWVVDTYSHVLAETPTRGLRHSIIHANIPTDHAIRAMSVLQSEFDAGYPEIQAPFMWWIGDTYAGNFGPRRSQRLEPLKTFQSGGIRWGSGSDYSVTPLAARYGLWASIAREPLKGVYGPMPFGKEESVDIRTALRSYTIWNARQLFLEDKIGSLEIGKAADIVVWDRDLYGVPSVAIKDLKCMLTIFDGKVVYRAIGFH